MRVYRHVKVYMLFPCSKRCQSVGQCTRVSENHIHLIRGSCVRQYIPSTYVCILCDIIHTHVRVFGYNSACVTVGECVYLYIRCSYYILYWPRVCAATPTETRLVQNRRRNRSAWALRNAAAAPRCFWIHLFYAHTHQVACAVDLHTTCIVVFTIKIFFFIIPTYVFTTRLRGNNRAWKYVFTRKTQYELVLDTPA